jgi:hypothetical protein
VLLQPVDDEAVWCEKTQPAIVLNGLQRAYPGIELLLRQLRLQVSDAAIPERCFGRQGKPQ